MTSVAPSTRHIISILVEDRFGELARIVGLFSGRGYNIDSLGVNRSIEPGMSRVVLTTRGDAAVVEQILKQVNKLVRVHKVRHLEGEAHLERELCVATVRTQNARAREELERVIKLTGARVLAFSATAFTVEATGTSSDIDHFLELLRPLGVRDMVRSAPIALTRAGSSEAEAHAVEVGALT
jgi:acetolactate synthase I/III small subunit